MNIVPSDQELSVVQRWLKKLIEANDEWDRQYGLGKYKGTKKERKPRKPKEEPKPPRLNKPKVVIVARDRRKEFLEAREKRKLSKDKGFVYCLKSDNGFYKIGMTNNIKRRLAGIRTQFPIKIILVHRVASNDLVM